MALTPSTMLALGTVAPDFQLPDAVSSQVISLKTFAAKKGLLVIFLCRHCPYVQHIKEGLSDLSRDYLGKDVGLVAISSNDAKSYSDDRPESLHEFAREIHLGFPVCYDETQEVAKAYTAACTPDFFLFDEGRKLVYRGQFDDSRPGNGKAVSGRDVRAALDALLSGKPISKEQHPSIGCNIKWKPGNAPSYFR